MTKTIVRGARGRRKKRREKKRRLEEEKKLEEEKARVKDGDLFKEDIKGRSRRKRPRKIIRLENQSVVERLTGDQQVNKFIADWKIPDPKRLWRRPKVEEPVSDLWTGPTPREVAEIEEVAIRKIKAPTAPENDTVKENIPTFAPETFQSFNPSKEQREEGLDLIGKHWDKYDGKRLKNEERHQKNLEAWKEGSKQREAEELAEQFLGSDNSDSESSVEEPGVRRVQTSRFKTHKSKRNKAKRIKEKMKKIQEEKEEKRFLQEFALLKKYNRMITDHMLECGARPKKGKEVRRFTAGSYSYEPMMPMLLTAEEIEDAKGALRRLAVHKDNLHEIINRYEDKRMLNPKVKGRRRRRIKKSFRTYVRFGSATTGILVQDLIKKISEDK